MKKLFIALCFMATSLKAQTVIINGQQYPQNDTAVITSAYADVTVMSPNSSDMVRIYYVGANSYYPPNFTEQFMVTQKPKLFRVYWRINGVWSDPYRVYLKR
mgnify:CR=1 FL=1